MNDAQTLVFSKSLFKKQPVLELAELSSFRLVLPCLFQTSFCWGICISKSLWLKHIWKTSRQVAFRSETHDLLRHSGRSTRSANLFERKQRGRGITSPGLYGGWFWKGNFSEKRSWEQKTYPLPFATFESMIFIVSSWNMDSVCAGVHQLHFYAVSGWSLCTFSVERLNCQCLGWMFHSAESKKKRMKIKRHVLVFDSWATRPFSHVQALCKVSIPILLEIFHLPISWEIETICQVWTIHMLGGAI